jgi:formate dehydrogenase major subunit
VQGGGDMGALPNRLPGFQPIEDAAVRAQFEEVWGVTVPPEPGLHLTAMFEAMEHGDLRAVYVVGENPAQGEADQQRAVRLLEGLDHLVIQDIFLTATAQLADVVLPAASTLAEAEGTVTSSERRVQRVRKAIDPPGEARDDVAIVYELARRMGSDLGSPKAEDVWNELRVLSPMHRGMSYARLEDLGGIQWPCGDEDDPGTQFLHGRLWDDVVEDRAPFQVVEHDPPVDRLDDDFPLRLTTGRRLESYNTGVQTGGYASPLHVGGEALLLAPEDGARYGVADGARARVVSRRGSVEAPVRYDSTLRPGLAFMNLHFPDLVATNVLTIDATDPKSGTAEFKATAIRLEAI